MRVANQYRFIGLSLMCGIFLGACSGSDSADTVAPPAPPEPKAEPPKINAPQSFSGSLVKAGETRASEFFKNGIYAAAVHGDLREFTADINTPSLAASSGISSTNTQEAGVDEADRIEYDGSYLYVSAPATWQNDVREPARVRVLKRNDDFSLTEVETLVMEDDQQGIEGMYLADTRLAVIASDFPIYPLAAITIEPWLTRPAKVSVSVYDVNEPSSAVSLADIDIDGWLLSSRRIGDELYLATSFVPSIEGIKPNPTSDEEKIALYSSITSASNDQLMPGITINGVTQPLGDVGDCYIPEQATENDGYAQMVNIVRINMQSPQSYESLCMSTQAFMLYVSESNAYLASDVEGNTAFHKIALSDLSYQASGEVKGQIGWRGVPSLRVDEEGDYFRVVATDYTGKEPVHSLTVLAQEQDQLTPVAILPNDAQPDAIGKPGEDVYAVRFIGDKGYIVTFEQIDPLYVIDFSVPEQPVLAGSLEIPGFSSYLHPLENGLLLGVGQDVTMQAVDPEDGGDDQTLQPVSTGVKVSLFDVRDPANPLELKAVVKEDAYSPVEFDYRALTFTEANGTYRFAMPLETWNSMSTGTGNAADSGIANSSMMVGMQYSLLMLETNTQDANPTLVEVDELVAPIMDNQFFYTGNDRSVIHGDHVYYVRGPQVWHAMWTKNEQIDGPY